VLLIDLRAALLLSAFLLPLCVPAQETLRSFDLSPSGKVHVTTDLVIKKFASTDFIYPALKDADPASIRARDVSKATKLPVHVDSKRIHVTLPYAPNGRAEFRLSVVEEIPATGLTVQRLLDKGRYVFHLPAGYAVMSCSLPSQIQTSTDRISLGLVQSSDVPQSLMLTMAKGAPLAASPYTGSFLALDNRIVWYDLQDPAKHLIRLWLEMYVDKPGQSHFYSQLRIPDQTSDPVTLDVDRGVELPTRIVSGKDANAIGDSPAPFPEDGRILVADLGYRIPEGGSARLRSFQTATDIEGYRLIDADTLRLDRFIARTRTLYLLPAGWRLTSMDQPGVLSTNADGRVLVTFAGNTGKSNSLTIIAERQKGN
jgi:hypothetical protein